MASPHSPASATFGARIRDARLRLGLSQIQVWQISGIHFTNIGKIERGEANPALHTIIRLADAVQVDPGELITGLTAADLPEDDRARILPENVREEAIRRRGH